MDMEGVMPTTRLQEQKFIDAIMCSSPLDEAIEWIKDHMSPEDVFDESELSEWAHKNGWEKPE